MNEQEEITKSYIRELIKHIQREEKRRYTFCRGYAEECEMMS